MTPQAGFGSHDPFFFPPAFLTRAQSVSPLTLIVWPENEGSFPALGFLDLFFLWVDRISKYLQNFSSDDAPSHS